MNERELKIKRHDQWCDLDGEGKCDCGVDKYNERLSAILARKDELLREAMDEMNDKIAFDKQDTDLIDRIRKETGEK